MPFPTYKFVAARWASTPTPSFPVEIKEGQTILSVDCPVCKFRLFAGPGYSIPICCMCCPLGDHTCLATRTRARVAHTRGNDA